MTADPQDHHAAESPRHRRVVTTSRRRLLAGAAALVGGLALSSWPTARRAVAAAATKRSQVRLTLPAPTGPYRIGTAALHLVDHDRQDPYWTTPHPRELMVNIWYPARGVGRLAPWMPPGALTYYRPELEEFLSSSPDTPPGEEPIDEPVSLAGVEFPITHAGQDVPVALSARPYPVVLFSPGAGQNREEGTTLVEELASHGYVVVTISHTYQAPEVEFPGGRVERGRREGPTVVPNEAVALRRVDVQFVLDSLTALAAGTNPDAGRRRLPVGLAGCFDMTKVGMFGHSLGGATTAQAMANDPRVIAGINLDGSFFPEDVNPIGAQPGEIEPALERIAERIGERPFMIMGSIGVSPDEFGIMTSIVWHNLRGWRRFISLVGSSHGSYTDGQVIFPQLAAAGIIPSADPWMGTIDPDRSIAAQRAYIRAFFDRTLLGRDSHLLDGPSAAYPEANFYM
ncbi:hypothetical protein [Micromonospora sp. HM5-17]|jgi:dienelactone hydrolase|uniref:alpha/beta hydrolase family protein n=1 Tax=Micromonospora sp. HM5-17 TaxID=2487710 RepID=UPI000F4AC748|nr:hypothetical protein [Micromonospora sp. HM5-17]ROT26070.1 hypothetical protein EF879_25950 [Micromonospora sp. HM5-17]